MKDILKYVGITTITAGTILLFLREKSIKQVGRKNVVFITGCDSGLGYNIAVKCYNLGFTVIAGCLNLKSDGALNLKKVDTDSRLHLCEIDTTMEEKIYRAYKFVKDILDERHDYEFTALINNAGVLIFGEFEWQTNELIDRQIKINLLGTMKTTKEFLPLLRKHRGRIINVTSHCSLQVLPGLATYSATKAGLRYWTEGLRMEMSQYGVEVVNFIPGSFVASSNIVAHQMEYAGQMRENFTLEQREFYGDYFEEYNSYLNHISGAKPPVDMQNSLILNKFSNALLEIRPHAVYKAEPFRYKIYHFLFLISPLFIRDRLVRKFIMMPMYKKPIKS